ncbi:MAG: diaminopimelate epimerase [Propionibacteriaceae bacterium]|nr:diaminopimelate epimerase [Propionibacteriaceae bacterium]
MRTWSFAKGHGTANDFVIVKDRSGLLNPSVEDVQFLCNRQLGIGADGLLRAVKAEHMPDWDGPGDIWFMDYRNADGSLAQMCGNGLRVFVQWLMEEDLAAGDPILIATRAGLRQASVLPDGRLLVTMGVPTWMQVTGRVRIDGQWFSGHIVDVDNPHCVIHLASWAQLADIDLDRVEPDPSDFPQGCNVEVVVNHGPGRLSMRVYERGVGETQSCGTGAVAVACDDRGLTGDILDHYRVDVPGGQLSVRFDQSGQASLTGPAVVVARGEVILPDEY